MSPPTCKADSEISSAASTEAAGIRWIPFPAQVWISYKFTNTASHCAVPHLENIWTVSSIMRELTAYIFTSSGIGKFYTVQDNKDGAGIFCYKI